MGQPAGESVLHNLCGKEEGNCAMLYLCLFCITYLFSLLIWVIMSTKLLFFFPHLCKKKKKCTQLFFSFLGLEDRGQKKEFCFLQDIISAWYSHLL